MTRFNFTFQEASPLITYSGLWMEGNPKNDTFADLYDGSFRVASTNTSKAKINFSGTGVTIFGAYRLDHGNYTVGLDGGESSTKNGSGNAFRQPLWQAYDLSKGSHTVEVANEPTASGISYDLDYVMIEREIGQDGNPIFNSSLPSTSSYVKYSGAWQGYSRDDGMINQTTELNSQLSITFQGACIELYGLYTNAEYAVSLDNHTVQPMSGMGIDLDPNMWHDDTLLYLMDALPEDVNHTVIVTTTQTSLQRPFFFNYAVVRGTQDIANRFSISSSIPTNSPAGNSTSSSSHSTPLALILGLSIGGAVLLALIITAITLFRRRRRVVLRADLMVEAEPYEYNAAAPPRPWILLGHTVQTSLDQPIEDSATPPPTLEPYDVPIQGRNPSRPAPKLGPAIPSVFTNLGQHSADGRPEDVQSSQSEHETWWSSNLNSVPSPRLLYPATKPVSIPTVQDGQKDNIERSSPQSAGMPEREEDAGVFLEETSQPEGSTLPPAYNPNWDQRR